MVLGFLVLTLKMLYPSYLILSIVNLISSDSLSTTQTTYYGILLSGKIGDNQKSVKIAKWGLNTSYIGPVFGIPTYLRIFIPLFFFCWYL